MRTGRHTAHSTCCLNCTAGLASGRRNENDAACERYNRTPCKINFGVKFHSPCLADARLESVVIFTPREKKQLRVNRSMHFVCPLRLGVKITPSDFSRSVNFKPRVEGAFFYHLRSATYFYFSQIEYS